MCFKILQKYGKFSNISLAHFIKHKPFISEELLTTTSIADFSTTVRSHTTRMTILENIVLCEIYQQSQEKFLQKNRIIARIICKFLVQQAKSYFIVRIALCEAALYEDLLYQNILHSGPEKKGQAKKLVKLNRSISRKIHFLQFKKWPNINL